MASESLKHDCAWAMSASIVEVFIDMLREDEVNLAFGEVYERVKAGLKAFEGSTNKKLNPSRN